MKSKVKTHIKFRGRKQESGFPRDNEGELIDDGKG
jgi:hypothetical protein